MPRRVNAPLVRWPISNARISISSLARRCPSTDTIAIPSSYVAPTPRHPPIPTAESRASSYSYPFLEKLRFAEPIPAAQRSSDRVTDPAAHPRYSHTRAPQKSSTGTPRTARHCLKPRRAPDSSNPPASKSALFSQTRSCFSRFAIAREVAGRISFFSWLGSEEAEKVRRSHVADSVSDYEKFREGLNTIFGRFEFEGAFRAQLRSLRQAGAESVTAYAARTTDLSSRAYAEFATEAQLSLAVDHFIGGLADTSTREYLLRERARRPLEWIEVVRIAQASETARLSSAPLAAAAACDSSAIVGPASTCCAAERCSRHAAWKCCEIACATESRAQHHAVLATGAITSSKPNVREQPTTRSKSPRE